jgi:hypothetical protein
MVPVPKEQGTFPVGQNQAPTVYHSHAHMQARKRQAVQH